MFKLRVTKISTGIVFMLGLIAAAIPQSALTADAPTIFRIGTASKSGTFYPIGKLIAEGISEISDQNKCNNKHDCGIRNLIGVAQVSNGSVANVEAVSSGSIEAGLAQADVIYWAYTGTGRFASSKPLKTIRVVANLFPGSLHIVTSSRSNIDSVDRLIGKKVALDEPGSGTLATAELILASVGISKDRLFPLYIKHHHAGPMLAKGELDAFFFVAGFPTRSVIDIAQQIDIRLVPLSEQIIRSLVRERPYFAPGTISANAYRGITKDIPTVNIGTQLIVREDLSEQLVYNITAALWSNRTRRLLDKGHPKGTQVLLSTALRGVAIPIHPGAERFYKEIGILKN